MDKRNAHLVGSFPGANAETAMRSALEVLGSSLWTLSDGETGERVRWIVPMIEGFRAHPDLEVTREGRWSSYEDLVRFRVKRGHSLRAEAFELGIAADFAKSYPVFQRLRAEAGLPRLAFQVGIPGDFDLALFSMGPLAALRHRKAFAEALLREVESIYTLAPEDVVFQIEVPAELVFVTKMPGPLQSIVAGKLFQSVANFVARMPKSARVGVHLCLGDLNHEALGQLSTAKPLIVAANALIERWPEGRILEFLHLPLVGANAPPSREQSFYSELQRLRVPPDVRVVAGVVHEDHAPGVDAQIVQWVEDALRRRVDVGAACGLGRRETPAARKNMECVAALTSGAKQGGASSEPRQERSEREFRA